MPMTDYKKALLNAIEDYRVSKGKALSARRIKDITKLKAILQQETEPHLLQRRLRDQIAEIKTGWWIFETGNSRLKNGLLHILQLPQYHLTKLLEDEMVQRLHQISEQQALKKQALTVLQQEKNSLENIISQQYHIIQEQEQQLFIQAQSLESKAYYPNYEAFLMNVLDKFIHNQELTTADVGQLLLLVGHYQQRLEQKHTPAAARVLHKIVEAYEFSFTTLLQGCQYLIQNQQLASERLTCIAHYANAYCQQLQAIAQGQSVLPTKIKHLVNSYYKDGAQKTVIAVLPKQQQAKVFEIKESLIKNYGSSDQQRAIAPLAKLRLADEWEAMKKWCQEQRKHMILWFKQKSTPQKPERDSEDLSSTAQKTMIAPKMRHN